MARCEREVICTFGGPGSGAGAEVEVGRKEHLQLVQVRYDQDKVWSLQSWILHPFYLC